MNSTPTIEEAGLKSTAPDPALPSTTPTAKAIPPSPSPAPPLDPIRLAWFYKPPDNGDLRLLLDFFDLFILTQKDEVTRDILKSSGVQLPILQYLLLMEIQNPGDCSSAPYGNQVAYERGDYCRLRREHLDWFLFDENGSPISDERTVYMDPASQGYRAFWLERAQRSQEELGWEGVFIDNIEASLLERRNLARRSQSVGTPVRYPDDQSYQAAVAGFLEYLKLNYFVPQNRPMWGNITATNDPQAWLHYLNYLDGAMIEAFAVDWSDGYLPIEEWEQQLDLAERAQDLGKSVLLVAQGHREDSDRQAFALASYLLINQGRAYFRYADACCYHQVWIYDNYSLDLGAPLGRRYTQGELVLRNFEKGIVIVDPIHHTASIEHDS